MPSFPLEVRLNGQLGTAPVHPVVTGEKLPEPVFPQHPEFLTEEAWPGDGVRHWPASKVWHAMRGWGVPWLQSRVLPGDFHPIIAYLFTE